MNFFLNVRFIKLTIVNDNPLLAIVKDDPSVTIVTIIVNEIVFIKTIVFKTINDPSCDR